MIMLAVFHDLSNAQANLYALALRANAYEKTGFKGLSRFIGMIDKIISSGNDLEEVADLVPKNAVSLMTIHKSKGLEFKYVFVLQMNRKFIGHSKDGLSGKYIINREKDLALSISWPQRPGKHQFA